MFSSPCGQHSNRATTARRADGRRRSAGPQRMLCNLANAPCDAAFEMFIFKYILLLLDIRQPLFQPGDVTQAQIVQRFSFAFLIKRCKRTRNQSSFLFGTKRKASTEKNSSNMQASSRFHRSADDKWAKYLKHMHTKQMRRQHGMHERSRSAASTMILSPKIDIKGRTACRGRKKGSKS